jgi:signal transduction histidine kinase/CheY-like chemotaxis protein
MLMSRTWQDQKHNWKMHMQEMRSRYVIQVLIIGCMALAVPLMSMSNEYMRQLTGVTCGALLALLFFFIRGVAVNTVVYIGVSLGTAYVSLIALVVGGIYSSALVWLPMLGLSVFFVIRPSTGRWWMVMMLLLMVVIATISLIWEAELPVPDMKQLAEQSFWDYFFATLAFYLVPDFYQQTLHRQMSDLKQRQRLLKVSHDQVAHAVQMRKHFVASISHELRTPMNAILGLNALLLESVQDKPQATRVLEYTRQSADHLMTVINDVLDYSQFSSGQLRVQEEVFELPVTTHAAFDLFMPKVENTTLNYRCDIDANVPRWVKTDRHRLMQVLVNLLGNAIKFTHQGEVVLKVVAQDHGVAFSVMDTGIGMTQQQLGAIFECYGQAHARIQSQYGGNGLGLTISQRLVQMLGGEMEVTSQLGQGSCFSFWLPLQAVDAPVFSKTHDIDVGLAQSTGRCFLVVDDHPVNRLLLRQTLLQHWPGSEVYESENGEKALQWMDEHSRDVFVLMDMVMPVMDGIEATKKIREREVGTGQHTPILGLTANVTSQDLDRFERAGLDGILLKPFDLSLLRVEVARLLSLA